TTDEHPADPAADGPAADAVERLHDLRLVRPPRGPCRPAVVDRCAGQLGGGVLRIHAAGAGEPDRIRSVPDAHPLLPMTDPHTAVPGAAPDLASPFERFRHIVVEGPIGAGK